MIMRCACPSCQERDKRLGARATQAVLDYFKAHPEAGEPPLFHHRDGIAKAVLAAINN